MSPMKINKLSFGILALLLASIWMAPVFAEKEDADAKEKLDVINSKIEKNKKVIGEKLKERKETRVKLGALSRQLKYTTYQLKKAKNDLQVTQVKKEKTQEKLTVVAHNFVDKQSRFEERMRQIHKNKNLGFMDFLFSSPDLLSAMESEYFFNKLLRADVGLITDMRTEQNQLSKQKTVLEGQTKQISVLKEQITKKETQISQQEVEKRNELISLEAQIRHIEQQNRELEESSQELTSFILKGSKGNTQFYGSGSFVRPVDGWVSSPFGTRMHPIFKRRIKHNGIDFAAPSGCRIRAADTGVVIVAGEKPQYRGYGKVTVIDHGLRKDGRRLATVYAHQSRILVHEGQLVKQGSEIGWVGSTGYSTGPHLHFEVRENGVPVDPMRYIRR